MTEKQRWRVTVAYATPERQEAIDVAVVPGATARQVINESGILERFPEIDLMTQRVGIFGELIGLEQPVQNGDRIEIYRPLTVDPREIRRRRAKIKSDARRRTQPKK